MRNLLALALPIALVILVPSSASAHHRHFDGLRIKDDVGCGYFRDDPSGPLTYVSFEGAVRVTETREDVHAVSIAFRLYDSETGELITEGFRRSATDEFHPSAAFWAGYEFYQPETKARRLIVTVRWKREGQIDIFHTREVARWPSEECQ